MQLTACCGGIASMGPEDPISSRPWPGFRRWSCFEAEVSDGTYLRYLRQSNRKKALVRGESTSRIACVCFRRLRDNLVQDRVARVVNLMSLGRMAIGVNMRLPVYVIHWNAPEWCAETVHSLRSSRGVEVDVTVIDNASEELPIVPESVKRIGMSKNVGFAGAANEALRLVDASGETEFFGIASHDVQVSPDCLAKCLLFATTHPHVGIFGPDFGENTAEQGWVSGSLMLLRTDCVEKIGAFDELFGSYCEEVDYCHRAIAHGWEIGFVEGATAHTHGSSDPSRARLLMNANFTLLAAKEGDWSRVLRRLAGMARRAIAEPGQGWAQSLVLSCKQLLRLSHRQLTARYQSGPPQT